MRLIHAVGVLAIVALAAAFAAGCGGSDDSSAAGGDVQFTGSGHPGIDEANTRSVKGPIDSTSVANLKPAWRLRLTGQSTYGSYASTPIIANGVVYSQDL